MKYIDLTMLFNSDIPVYPGDPKPIIKQCATYAQDGWNEHEYTVRSHHGTHIDYPLHMVADGKTQNDYDLDKHIGTGKIFDVRGKRHIDENLDSVEEGDIVLFCTGSSGHNQAPVITQQFADALVAKKVKMIGLDTWSADKGAPFPIHKTLLGNDILIVEGLTNLDKLLGKKFKVYVAPLKMDNFDGSPCRVFAEIL